MSRITAAHIGIEQLSAIRLDEQEQSLPGRYALLPDGHSIEPHISRLYPANLAERTLLDFATPDRGFHDLCARAILRRRWRGCGPCWPKEPPPSCRRPVSCSSSCTEMNN